MYVLICLHAFLNATGEFCPLSQGPCALRRHIWEWDLPTCPLRRTFSLLSLKLLSRRVRHFPRLFPWEACWTRTNNYTPSGFLLSPLVALNAVLSAACLNIHMMKGLQGAEISLDQKPLPYISDIGHECLCPSVIAILYWKGCVHICIFGNTLLERAQLT